MKWADVVQWFREHPSVSLVLAGFVAGSLVTLVFTWG